MFIAYLDEFGHIGPYLGRSEARYSESPVFGMAGIILPADRVRSFATWFFQRKQELLRWEIERAGKHPATWEKKGAALFTSTNIKRYPELRKATIRLLNQIEKCNGHIIYVGIKKISSVAEHNSRSLYLGVLRETIKRLDQYFDQDRDQANFLIVMDQHAERQSLLTAASSAMFGSEPRRRLIEPPFQVESHRYQTVQAADWICGLVGRWAAFQRSPDEFADWGWSETYFGAHLRRASKKSGIQCDNEVKVDPKSDESIQE